MLFHGSSTSPFAILCAALLLVSQGQGAVALPLRSAPTATVVTAVTHTPQHTNHDARPWYIRRRFQSPEIQPCDHGTQEDCDNIFAIHPLVTSPTVTPRNAKNLVRQLMKRAPAFSENLLTGLFVALIVGSVLLGAGIASIAVFGFDWKRALRKSEKREAEEGPGRDALPHAS
jgi:hypothetical protein